MIKERALPFNISRELNAPIEAVWRAWTEADQLAEWWGPKGFACDVRQLDLRPDGLFHYKLGTGNQVMWGRFRYELIERPNRLVYVSSFSDESSDIAPVPFPGAWPKEIRNGVVLEDLGGRTRLHLVAEPLDPTDEEAAFFNTVHESLNGGFSGTLDQLEAYLAAGEAQFEDRDLPLPGRYAAPAERLWAAWTQPAILAQWFAPDGFEYTAEELDLRPGGVWRSQFQQVGGDCRMASAARFIEVVPNRRLVFWQEANGDFPGYLCIVKFEERDGQTEITGGMRFASSEDRQKLLDIGVAECTQACDLKLKALVEVAA